MKNLILILLPAILLFTGCKDQSEKDENAILDYIEANNLTTERTEDGIHYVIDVEGTGDHPTIADNIEVHYEGEGVFFSFPSPITKKKKKCFSVFLKENHKKI